MNVVGSFAVRKPHKFQAPSTPETNTTITIDEATLGLLNGGVKSECKCKCETVVGERGEKGEKGDCGEKGEKGERGEQGESGKMPKCYLKTFHFSNEIASTKYQLTGIEEMFKNNDVVRVETTVKYFVKKNREIIIKMFYDNKDERPYAIFQNFTAQDGFGSITFFDNIFKFHYPKSAPCSIAATVKDKTKKEHFNIEIDMFMYGMNVERNFCQMDDGPHRSIEYRFEAMKNSNTETKEEETVEETVEESLEETEKNEEINEENLVEDDVSKEA